MSIPDVLRVKTDLCVVAFAYSRQRLAYIPDDLFPKPEWTPPPNWPVGKEFPSLVNKYPAVAPATAALLDNGVSVVMYDKHPGKGSATPRKFLVEVKGTPSNLQDLDENKDIARIILMQCRNARHSGAMLPLVGFVAKPGSIPLESQLGRNYFSCRQCKVSPTAFMAKGERPPPTRGPSKPMPHTTSPRQESQAPSVPALQAAVLPTTPPLHPVESEPVALRVVVHAATETPPVGEVAGVFRHLSVGNEKLARDGLVDVSLNLNPRGDRELRARLESIKDLKSFVDAQDDAWWSAVGYDIGPERLQVRALTAFGRICLLLFASVCF